MRELWSTAQIRETLPKEDSDIIDMLSSVYKLRSQGNKVEGLDLGDYVVEKFTHVFEEYNEVILDVKGKNLTVRIRHTREGLEIAQVWREVQMVPVVHWLAIGETIPS